MSLKKKLGSKLAQGVRQVKTQRDPAPTATSAAATASAKPAPTKAAVAPAQRRPRRVWPD